MQDMVGMKGNQRPGVGSPNQNLLAGPPVTGYAAVSMQPDTPHLKYRADIDGLRAVAVIAVVLYHAFPKPVPGGFVGVDTFFVISGYLITGIILGGLDRPRGFSFADFYARRGRRIFPALILGCRPRSRSGSPSSCRRN